MFDLNSLVDGLPDSAVINTAFSINNKGDILTTALSRTWSESKHTLLLTPIAEPVPEPQQWVLLLAGIGGMYFARRRRSALAL